MNFWLLIGIGVGIVIAAIAIFLYYQQRRKYEQVLEHISCEMERLIAEKLVISDREVSDSLPSKVEHQLIRLQTLVTATREQAVRDKNEIRNLIVDIAHQLRMPLANIETYTELLRKKELTDIEKETSLLAIEESWHSLHFLIESFIKMARLDNAIIQIHMIPCDLRETCMSAILRAEKRALEKNIYIELDCPAALVIPHDKNWLGEALFNLIDNSIKYSSCDSRIKISVEQNEMFTEIQIRDWGIGVVKNEENDIFKRFYRGSNVTTQEGFGIGLYLSKQIVEQQHGFIRVKRKNCGTVFSIFLQPISVL
ncbi:MAG: HAMP domain-containing histidine kinase [Clostridiales Family XIII bacterium]|jgi:signal transduction histidine kinase|nr:HAMP domain-containing histidine kinase [Clostridiales Family XIII bacterium]